MLTLPCDVCGVFFRCNRIDTLCARCAFVTRVGVRPMSSAEVQQACRQAVDLASFKRVLAGVENWFEEARV